MQCTDSCYNGDVAVAVVLSGHASLAGEYLARGAVNLIMRGLIEDS